MIKNDLVNRVTRELSVSRTTAVLAVETVINALLQSLVRGDRIELRGFGVFEVKNRKRGIGRNPKRPQEEVVIPPGLTIRFKPGKELRNMVVEGAPEVPPAADSAEGSK
jgi:DNA-binding protein HU-beta